jgi:hypothetical protein
MGQNNDSTPSIHIGSKELNTVDTFQYLGSIISANLFLARLEPEINSRMAEATAVICPGCIRGCGPTTT